MNHWNKIENSITNAKREYNHVEQSTLGGVVLPLIRIWNYDVYLYGAAEGFESILSYLRANDVEPKGIIFQNDDEIKSNLDLPIIKISQIEKINWNNSYVIVTLSSVFQGIGQQIMRGDLKGVLKKKKKTNKLNRVFRKVGIRNYYYIYTREIKDIYMFPSEFSYIGANLNPSSYNNRIYYYRNHIAELKYTYNLFEDEASKFTMGEYIRTYMQSGIYKGEFGDGRYKYFRGYGSGIFAEELYIHLHNEVWLNCGAAMGDSIFLFFANGYSAKKIYAYEGEKSVYTQLINNIKKLPNSMKEIIKPINEIISNTTEWESKIDEKITFVNADIEGAELDLLRTMSTKIASDRPVIAVCVYHRQEDLNVIPKYIQSIVGNYKFCLRKYPCSVSNPMMTAELVLYAIPEERYCGV